MEKITLGSEPNSTNARTGKSLTKIDDPNLARNGSGISKFNIEIAQGMDRTNFAPYNKKTLP
jgi:hypothetical protein